MEEVIVIIGPTCSGKTKFSLYLAELLDTEIISADSRQVYKYLDIGTAKPSPFELKIVKHHFIDELDPNQEFNACLFAKKAEIIIKKLLSVNKIPIIVGGSGLYVKALIDGITKSADTDYEIRKELAELKNKFGNDYLYNELKKIDPESASTMLPQNWKRVIRALEVYKITGKKIWQHHKENQIHSRFNFAQLGLLWERKKLYQNIDNRVDEMFKAGIVNEVKSVIEMGYSENLNSLNTVGYKEILQYFNNQITLDKAKELIKRNTRRYAKRQLTWFNADKRISWININSSNELELAASKLYKDLCK